MRFIQFSALTIALVLSTGIHAQENREKMPEAVRSILDSLDINHDGATVEVRIEKDGDRKKIHIVVEPKGQREHDENEHHDEQEEWKDKLVLELIEVEKALEEARAELKAAKGSYTSQHPKVRGTAERVNELEIVMREIELKLREDEEHDEHGHHDELDERRHHIHELEEAVERESEHLEELANKFGKNHPKVRDVYREVKMLKRELEDSVEELEWAEQRKERAGNEWSEEEDEEHDEDEVVEELFDRLDELDERMDEIEEKLEAIIRLFKKRD
jgi:chromosome segregation ATPase